MAAEQQERSSANKGLTNVEIVVFALAQMSDGERPCHLEDIAVAAFKYAPGPFGWDLHRFADRVDKDKVRVSLTDAQKPKQGTLARAVGPKRAGVSKPTDAWQLTPSGSEWFLANGQRIATRLGLAVSTVKKGKANKIRQQIERSQLYVEYRDGGHVNYDSFAFTDLLECSPDARIALVQERFDSLSSQVALLQDEELLTFLREAATTHNDMLLEDGGIAR